MSKQTFPEEKKKREQYNATTYNAQFHVIAAVARRKCSANLQLSTPAGSSVEAADTLIL